MRARRRTILVVVPLLAVVACSKQVLSPDLPGSPAEPGVSRNAAVARMATRYLGAPYRWAGAGPSGFDCSGLVSYLFAKVGVSLPHNAAQQYRHGTPVSRDRLEPGDVVFFNRLRHNGIYLGNGQFIHASKPGGVKIGRLDNEWFRRRWVGARRL